MSIDRKDVDAIVEATMEALVDEGLASMEPHAPLAFVCNGVRGYLKFYVSPATSDQALLYNRTCDVLVVNVRCRGYGDMVTQQRIVISDWSVKDASVNSALLVFMAQSFIRSIRRCVAKNIEAESKVVKP